MLQRIDKLRQTLKEKNIDAILVSNFYNILYLSGFKTLTENEREAWMLITARNTYLFSDNRYINDKSQITNNNSIINNKFLIYKLITPEKGLIKHLEEIFQEEGIKNCGVEADNLKLLEFQQLIKYFRETMFVPTEKLIIKQREIKDEDEIKKIKKACEIVDLCLKDILRLIEVEKTEKEIAFRIEFWLKEKNYDLAFYPIVAIDENSAVPHYDTRNGNNKKARSGSIILIDFGAKYQDYVSDITRMIFVGKPTDEQIDTYNKLLGAQTKTIKYLTNLASINLGGGRGKQVDQYCRQMVTENQLPNYQHSTGHGVGLEVHEYPKISPISEDRLLENQVVTIEPGVYFEEKWGIRIEDTVLVKKDGVETLTKFSKQLLNI
ncbi:MAG: Peptidase M24 [Candidatus Roizmanbacteria bacterium GW2011_GWC2_37_13]|uniref:Peptidase M24 n=1 Tax=Candidatus Roizmanbacteria bacterium GW2011_GWC2_37_13 TaxID=1618486 RepID=A0A0G0JDG6_9BACT|nr:MAG: Peptidase M24 [Candidatus Roizmanbacteria bacterium GW2011_GWC1_37_12]KKQ26211.1 MAG: Peptidase M24 [Candidatus Roizmanbacteria bacterium GW2011_GWC2_37_13]